MCFLEVIEVRQSRRIKEGVVSRLEIERKWVLGGVSVDGLFELPRSTLRQGYIISDTRGEIRIRSSSSEEETEFTLTVKGSGDLFRSEVEDEISSEMFSALWPRCRGSFEKFRFEHLSGVTIDVFTTPGLQGLVIAKMEFDTIGAAESFTFPTDFASRWIDVTKRKDLKGKNLALEGLPPDCEEYLSINAGIQRFLAQGCA